MIPIPIAEVMDKEPSLVELFAVGLTLAIGMFCICSWRRWLLVLAIPISILAAFVLTSEEVPQAILRLGQSNGLFAQKSLGWRRTPSHTGPVCRRCVQSGLNGKTHGDGVAESDGGHEATDGRCVPVHCDNAAK